MTRPFFAGSYGDEDDALSPDALLECRICWWVYDPAIGDDVRQIPAGTPFAALPKDWACPVCSGQRSGFLLMDPP